MICSLQAPASPIARAGGGSELVGDVLITCSGGTPTAIGMPAPSADVVVLMNFNVSNRVAAGGFTDALLIVDEPHATAHPTSPLLACGAAASNDDGSGICAITGDGSGKNTYSGLPGHPNVFQGRWDASTPNAITFKSVPVDPPEPGGLRIIRITNIRINANQFGSGLTLPAPVMSFVNAMPALTLPLSNSQVQIGEIEAGISVDGSAPAELNQCSSANPRIATDPSKPLDTGGQNGAQYSITLTEGFEGAFKAKNVAQQTANAAVNGHFGTAYPPDMNQNVPGAGTNTETGFFNGSETDPDGQAIPKTAAFPALRSLNAAGAADQGTRLYVKFSDVPAGVKLFVPAVIDIIDVTSGQASGSAVLVSAAPDGSGTFTRIAAGPTGLAQATADGNTAIAFYEVLHSDPAQVERVTIPVAAAYVVAGYSDRISANQIRVEAGFAPLITGFQTDSSSPIPRFAASSEPVVAFNIQRCGLPDLTVSTTHSGVFEQASSGNSITMTVTNSGQQPTSGDVVVVDSLPVHLTATAISGQGWTCALYSKSCTRNDPLPGGSSYPPVTMMVDVAADAPTTVTNSVLALGGGETQTTNSSTQDVISIAATENITVSTSEGLTFSVDGLTYVSSHDFQWRVGTTHTVAVTSPQISPGGSPLVFRNWSDNGAISHTITVGSAPATYIAVFVSPGDAVQCTAQPSTIPIRGEALADYTGDLVLDCTGGFPTAAAATVPHVDIRLQFNTSVSSRLTSPPGYTEALLLMDEPHTPTKPNVPLLACADANNICWTTGDGHGSTTYDGQSGHPNVFQGRLDGSSAIVFSEVPFDPPGVGGHRVLRFTNMRVNAHQLGALQTGLPAYVTVVVSVTPRGVAVPYDEQRIASVQPGLVRASSPKAELSQCLSANAAIAANPAAPLETDGQNGSQFNVVLTEGFETAWRPKNAAQFEANGTYVEPGTYRYIAGSTSYGAGDYSQNTPGAPLIAETGLSNGAVKDPTGIAWPSGAPRFPSLRGLDIAGKADSGTRIRLTFTPVSAGITLFVPTTIAIHLSGNPDLQTGVAVLIATDANGAGVYSPFAADGNASGVEALVATGNTATAVYEVLFSDPAVVESISVPVAAAYIPDAERHQPTAGAITVAAELGPLSGAGTSADSTEPAPRFVATGVTQTAFEIQACSLPDLVVAVSHSGNFTQGDAAAKYHITVSNTGETATTGVVSVVDTLPSGMTAVAISGAGWTCSLASLTCTRTDPLGGNSAYPDIELTVSVAVTSATTLTNSAAVSGPADGDPTNNSAVDSTAIVALPETVVSTSPPGVAFMVDGVSYNSSQTFKWSVGSDHTVAVASPQAVGPGTRYTFSNWSDGGALSHTIRAGTEAATYIATFTQEHQLTVFIWPSGAGVVSPAAGQYFGSGSTVPIQAVANTGYVFIGWNGEVAAPASASTSITMSGPRTVTAQFTSQLRQQLISFDPVSNHVAGDAPFALFASASSKLPVTYTVMSGPAILSGNIVRLTGTGIVNVCASQPGNSLYAAAPTVCRVFTVTAPPAHYALMLTTIPSEGGSLNATPKSSTGAYAAGATIHVSASAAADFVFTGFSGDVMGISNPLALVMSQNRTVAAHFARVSNKPEDQVTLGVRSGDTATPSSVIKVDGSESAPVIRVIAASGPVWLRAALLSGSKWKVEVSLVIDAVQKLASGSYTGYVLLTTPSAERLITVNLFVDAVRVERVVDAAGYMEQGISPGGLFTAGGANLARHSVVGDLSKPADALDGTTVEITDAAGHTSRAALQYVSPGQVNFLAPADLAQGEAQLEIRNDSGQIGALKVKVQPIAPGLFAADATGTGLAAATVLKVFENGSRANSLVADCSTGTCARVPIDVSGSGDRIFISLYGTGISGRSSLDAVTVQIGDIPVEVLYAGPQQQYPGLDQVNIEAPASLAGRGELNLKMVVDGHPANAVTIFVK